MMKAVFTALSVLSVLCIIALGLHAILPPNLDRYNDTSKLVVAHDGSILRAFISDDDMWRFPIRYSEVDPKFIEYLLAYEDKRFWYHFGVDPLALTRAVGQLVGAGQVISGASTITMQVARLLEPRPRTLTSKILEVIRATQLELMFSKKEILSIYLTLAPYGGNIEGIKAASLLYFNKQPNKLTVSEAALLVALPQSPSRTRPDKNIQNASAARDKVLHRLLNSKIISEKDIVEAKQIKIEGDRYSFPFLSPHLARRLVKQDPSQNIFHTHIKKELQISAQQILEDAIEAEGKELNGAAIIVDNKTGAVISYVASSDFFNQEREGQVDYIRAIRSPGSALKPFIYAMAFSDNIAHPETIISDEMRRYGAYRPSNFDGVNYGEVAADYALRASLNTPAVLLLDKIGPRRFLSRLRTSNYIRDMDDTGPGLSIALGGLGISLEQLVARYTAFANGGIFKELSLLNHPRSRPGIQLFDNWSSHAVLNILRQTEAPEGRYSYRSNRRVAFKTGTSSGYRDVLAVGIDDTYTIGVWIGHPKAEPMIAKTGIKTAAPVLFRLFDVLPDMNKGGDVSGTDSHKQVPKNLRRIYTRHGDSKLTDAASFKIGFPVDGSKIPFPFNGTEESIFIRLVDGSRPFNVFINGEVVESGSLSRTMSWVPKNPGFYSIVAIDKKGRVSQSKFELASTY